MSLRHAFLALGGFSNVLAADDAGITSTLTLESFVTVVVSPTGTSSSTNGLGDFIMQGLGGSDTSTSSIQALLAPATIAPFPTGNTTAELGWEACQNSQVSWSEAWTSFFQPKVITETNTFTRNIHTITFNVTYGDADIYTTIDGIPRAHGTLTPTSTSSYVSVYSETEKSTTTWTETLNATFPNPSPSCTIAPSRCTALWQSYLGEHGMPTTFDNATEPAITPMPTQRPRCSVGDADWVCTKRPLGSCIFSASRVDLYYWPTITAAPNATLAMSNSSDIATQVVGNITMSSPSVYMVFDRLQASFLTNLDPDCTATSPLGANTTVMPGLAGGAAASLVGSAYTNAIVSLDPSSLQSLVRDLGPVNTASVVSEIAHGGPSYEYWVNAVQGTGYNYDAQPGYDYSSMGLAKSVDINNIAVPDAQAYYMNINGAPGCNRRGEHPECSTIFDGAYRAQLLVPEQIRSLRPEWADCFDPLFGALDPPIALTPAATMKGPSKAPDADLPVKPDAPKALTSVEALKTPEATPASPGPTVQPAPSPTTPLLQSDPSAVPDTKPNDESEDEPASQDEPASDDESISDGGSSSTDAPTSNEKPAPDDKPQSGGQPGTGLHGEAPQANEGSPKNTKSPAPSSDPTSETPSSGDQGTSTDGNGEQQPQNALDVLTAAQHSEAAKASSLPGESVHNDPSDGHNESNDGNLPSNPGSNDRPDENDDNVPSSDIGNSSPVQIVDIGGNEHTISAQNGIPVIDGTTLSMDGSPKTINGQVVSAAGGNLMIGTETLRLASEKTAGSGNSRHEIFTVKGQVFTASPGTSNGDMSIDGTTISKANSAVTINGATISAASDGIVVDGSTMTYASDSGLAQPTVLTLGSDVATASRVSSDVFAVGAVTLTASGAGKTISSHAISAASTGIVMESASTSHSASSSHEEPQTSQISTSATQSDVPSATGSGAARLDAMLWAVMLFSCLVLLL